MRPLRKIAHLSRERDRAHREAARDRLRQAQEVRPDPVLLRSENRPGPAEAGLHLVDDQEGAALLAETRGLGHELGARRPYAAFALNELNDECGSLLGDRGVERVRLVEGDV